MKIHPNWIFDHLGGTRLGICRLLILGLNKLLHILLTENLHAESLKNLKISIRLNGVNNRLRKDLIELFVGDVSAISLATVLDIIDNVVKLRLTKDGHSLHRRKDRLSINRRLIILSKTRQRLRCLKACIALVVLNTLASLNFCYELIGIKRINIYFLVIKIFTIISASLFLTTWLRRFIFKKRGLHRIFRKLLFHLGNFHCIHGFSCLFFGRSIFCNRLSRFF